MAPVLVATLLPHQQDALAWCKDHEETGCILADDMGLGKTVTSCALIASCAPGTRTLVVAPLALLEQWQSEIHRHTTGLTAAIYHGPSRMDVPSADIIITTASTVASDFKRPVGASKRPVGASHMYSTFGRLIVDEAHKLKNRKATTHMIFQHMFKNTPRKVLLTGTPICNNINDMISLITLLNLDPYSSSDFWNHATLAKRIKHVNEIKASVLLHRTKDMVLDGKLPPISIRTSAMPLPGEQAEAYKTISNQPYDCKLIKILRMRQAANNTRLADPDLSTTMCKKISQIHDILSKIPKDEKVVIFSQWVTMLQLVADTLPTKPLMYHGKCTPQEKKDALLAFREDNGPDSQVMCVTLKSGGCGLNLTSANHTIIVEPYFNHAEERQAIDRIYRIGQTRPVYVHKLCIAKSVENWMRMLQTTKCTLSGMMLRDAGTEEDIADCMDRTRKMFDAFVDGGGESEGDSEGDSEGEM